MEHKNVVDAAVDTLLFIVKFTAVVAVIVAAVWLIVWQKIVMGEKIVDLVVEAIAIVAGGTIIVLGTIVMIGKLFL